MAQLQNLEIAFGSETNPTMLTNGQVDTVVDAIATKRNSSVYSITRTTGGVSQLSGFIKPANNGSITESNKYILEHNNITVLGNVATESYKLNTEGMTNLKEGNSLQIYCQNLKGNNVSMQSMSVLVFIDFDNVNKAAVLPISTIQSQFNVTWDANPLSDADFNLIFPGQTNSKQVYKGKLNSSQGVLNFNTSMTNYSWSGKMIFKAYPTSLDTEGAGTTTIYQRLTKEDVSVDLDSIAVTGAEIVCNRSSVQANVNVKFSTAQLLPTNNTKKNLIPIDHESVSYALSVDVGTIDGHDYMVPNTVEQFTVTCHLNYMNQTLVTHKQFNIINAILSMENNYGGFMSVKTALGLQEGVQSFTNEDAQTVTNQQMISIMSYFEEYAVEDFSCLEYFTKVTEITIPEGENTHLKYLNSTRVTTIRGTGALTKLQAINLEDFPAVTTISDGNLLQGNEIITNVNLPSLSTIRCDVNNMFNGCKELKTVSLPLLATIYSPSNYMFSGCISLETIDVSGVSSYTGGVDECMFLNCKSLTSLSMFPIGNLTATNSIKMFEGCESLPLTGLDVSGITKITATNGDITLFKNCKEFHGSIDMSAVTEIRCLNGTCSLFDGCAFLDSIDLSGLTTLRVKVNNLVSGCRGISSLNLGSLTSYTASQEENMCNGCTGLSSLTFPVAKIDCSGKLSLCQDCTSLDSVNLGSIASIKCSNNYMFKGCSGLNSLSLNTVTFITCADNEMFKGCTGFETVSFNNLDSINGTGDNYMFDGCTLMSSSSFPKLTTLSCKDNYMYKNLSSLTTYSYPKLATLSCSGTNRMFCGTGITTINFPELKTMANGSGQMFKECSVTSVHLDKLESITNSVGDDETFKGITTLSGAFSLANLKTLSATNGSIKTFEGDNRIYSINMSKIQNLSARNTLDVFKGCSNLSTLTFGNRSTTTNNFTIKGDAKNMFNGVSLSRISAWLRNSGTENDNPITSRITSLETTNLFYGLNLNGVKVVFPSAQTAPNSPLFYFNAAVIKIA